MTSRGITILGLIQLFTVFGIIAAARISLRLAEVHQDMLGRYFHLPTFLRLTQNYGVALLLIPILWTLGAVWLNRSCYSAVGGISVSGATGIALVLGLLYLFFSTIKVLFY